jgi:hypothetical protein
MPACGLYNPVYIQVALDRRRSAYVRSLVGATDVESGAVGIGIDGYRTDSHFPQGPDDSNGDFAAIGDEDFMEQTRSL